MQENARNDTVSLTEIKTNEILRFVVFGRRKSRIQQNKIKTRLLLVHVDFSTVARVVGVVLVRRSSAEGVSETVDEAGDSHRLRLRAGVVDAGPGHERLEEDEDGV